jgi:hypothetical protein
MKKLGEKNAMRLLSAVAVSILVLNAAQAQNSLSNGSIFQVEDTPSLSTNDFLSAISGDAENDVWAVGSLSLHFDGNTWTAIPLANTNQMAGVAVLSPTNVWAVGDIIRIPFALVSQIQHFDGDSWSVVESPHFPSGEVLKAIQAVSDQDIFAVGSFKDQFQKQQPLVEHFDGTAWSIVSTPQFDGGEGAILNSIAIISDSDIWAVGRAGSLDFSNDRPFAMHFDGDAWTEVGVPSVENSQFHELNAVVAVATDDVWAVGAFIIPASPEQTLIVHFDGTAWSIVPSPNQGSVDNVLFGVAAVSSNSLWAIGCSPCVDVIDVSGTLIEHWDGAQWTVTPAPDEPSVALAALGFPSGSVFVAGIGLTGTRVLTTTAGRR